MTKTIVLVLALVLGLGTARADSVTVGLFAPTAPFPSTSARVELATRLGEHVGKALGKKGTGKVFARSSDFAAAVRRGEVTVALVDAAYLAIHGGNYTVIAAAVRGGETAHEWQLVARRTKKLADLEGKRVLVPGVGGRESELVLNALLSGEVRKGFFAKIEAAPDTVSAVAALGLGKADAAVVPVGVELPAGTHVLARLPALAGPVLVTYAGITARERQTLAASLAALEGDRTVAGFRPADGEAVKQIARRFIVPDKRGPFAVPAARLLVGELVEGRELSIERTPVTAFAATPR